jgi:hypothetical protein
MVYVMFEDGIGIWLMRVSWLDYKNWLILWFDSLTYIRITEFDGEEIVTFEW